MGAVKSQKSKLRAVSLFCGIGGMDLGISGGFEFLGRRYSNLPTSLVCSTDFDERALKIHQENFSHPTILGDITQIGSDLIPEHDILTGGFPCQSFSVAATNPPRLGYKDIRGQLFFEMVRVLKDRKPAVFIAENVKGLLSANDKKAFPLVIREFENAGYHVVWKVLNAADFGVPQKRQRVFIVGFRGQEAFEKFEFPSPASKTPVALSEILETGPVDESFFFSEKAVLGMRQTKNSSSMNKGRAQNPDSPCNTVGAHLAKVSLNSTDPVYFEDGRYRMFTPREVARIQSFPESFVLSGSKSVQYRGLGNAVAPVVMWHLTKAVIAALSKETLEP